GGQGQEGPAGESHRKGLGVYFGEDGDAGLTASRPCPGGATPVPAGKTPSPGAPTAPQTEAVWRGHPKTPPREFRPTDGLPSAPPPGPPVAACAPLPAPATSGARTWQTPGIRGGRCSRGTLRPLRHRTGRPGPRGSRASGRPAPAAGGPARRAGTR